MSAAHCEIQLGRLGILKGVPAEIFEYFAALDDVPEDVLTKAVGHALKTRMWFPTPAELRADCDAVTVTPPAALEPHVEEVVGGGREVTFKNPLGGADLTVHVVREWKFDCDDCRDTGWRARWCGTQPHFRDVPMETCGRRHAHDPHEWVEPCACRASNPTIRRRRAAAAKYSQAPEKVGA